MISAELVLSLIHTPSTQLKIFMTGVVSWYITSQARKRRFIADGDGGLSLRRARGVKEAYIMRKELHPRPEVNKLKPQALLP